MKYRLIDTKPQVGTTVLGTVLNNRGIHDLHTMLKVPSTVQLPHSLLNNVDKAVNIIVDALKGNMQIGLLVDCDVDGYTSAATFYNYIHCIAPMVDINLFFHEGKKHGLSDDVFTQIRESNTELLVIVDAGSNDYKQLEVLYDDGMEVVVMDHHECEYESGHATIVNNQLSTNYTNKNLSGVGVVYKVCKAIDEYLNVSYADLFLDLVALGNIADSMSLYELETRYLVQAGMDNINNTLLQSIIYKQSFSMGGKVNITTVGWNVAPMLNAVIRIGTKEDKRLLFEGFISNDKEFCTSVVTRCLAVQRKQNAEVKKAIPIISKIIESNETMNNKVITVDVTDVVQRELIGLVANKLLSQYKKPILLLHNVNSEGTILGGSVRSPRELSFKAMCKDTKEFIFCEGHGGAFGCQILKDNIESAVEKLNQKLYNFTPSDEKTYDVDAVINYNELNPNDVMTIGDLRELWGNEISEPIFVVKNIRVNTGDISLIGKKNTIKMKLSKLDCMKFFTNEADYNKLTMNSNNDFFGASNVKVDIVCKFKTNEWQGNKKPQLEIIDYVVERDKPVLSLF